MLNNRGVSNHDQFRLLLDFSFHHMFFFKIYPLYFVPELFQVFTAVVNYFYIIDRFRFSSFMLACFTSLKELRNRFQIPIKSLETVCSLVRGLMMQQNTRGQEATELPNVHLRFCSTKGVFTLFTLYSSRQQHSYGAHFGNGIIIAGVLSQTTFSVNCRFSVLTSCLLCTRSVQNRKWLGHPSSV